MIKSALSLIILLVVGLSGQAIAKEVVVTARVDRDSLPAGESLQMEVTITNGKGVVDISGITDFKVLSRGTSSSVQIINGRMSQEEAHAYLLIPQRQGKLTIPPLPVDVDGRTYTTTPLTISVRAQQSPDGSAAGSDREAWVTATVSNPSPFLGQQLTYTFRLTNRVQINDAKFQPPAFEGFTAKEIKDRRSFRKTINGRDHMVTEVYYILTALSTGEHTIEPAVLQVGLLRQHSGSRRSPFDDFFNRGTLEQRVLQTEAVSLSVRALPPLDKDLAFSGLVGQFDLDATVETDTLKVGDSATLRVTVQGQGNVMDAEAPAIEVPSGFKQYADNPEEVVTADRRGFSGKKVFRIALVPVEEGTFTLSPARLVYFDVGQGAYRTLTAAIPPITVLPPDTAQVAPVTITPEPLRPLKKQVAFTGRDILPPKESLEAIASQAPLSGVVFMMALAGPALVYFGLVLVQRLRRKDSGPAAIMAARARDALRLAQGGNGQATLTALHQALTAAILAAAGRTGAALTWKEARSLLKACGQSAAAEPAAELLAQIESHKFSGTAANAARLNALIAETRAMVGKLLP
jgi:hypothetical protein